VFIQILNVLAEDLYARGQINLAVSTARRASQKGALPSAKPNAAKGASSWQFLAFLSPFTYRVLRRTNPNLLSPRLFCGG